MHPKQHNAFTLVELLVVLVIISLLIGLGAAAVRGLVASNRTNAALQTVEAAVASTRAQVGGRSGFEGYRGMALLFTPSDLRIVRHVDRNADGTPLKKDAATPLARGFHAYADVAGVDYAHVPPGAGVVGVARSAGRGLDGLVLLTPPFALTFDQNGAMAGPRPLPSGDFVARSDASAGLTNTVLYDGDYDRHYEWDSIREAGYDPRPFDPGSESYDRAATGVYDGRDAYSGDANKPIVPFEQVETAVAVIVYDRAAMVEAGHSPAAAPDGEHPANPLSDAARDWILRRVEEGEAEMLLFNRYTGERLGD